LALQTQKCKDMVTPTFDTLPGMVYSLQQKVDLLQATIEKLIATEPPAPVDEQRIYGDKGLAEYLNCTPQTIYRLKQLGRIPFHRYGRKYYYLRSEIDKAFKGKGQK